MVENFLGYRQYDIKLPVWNGPLDLLLDLVRASKVKISDIPIKEITNQYIHMIEMMKSVDMELSSDFLVMASTLILIKTRILIAEEMDDDASDFERPQKELIEKLLVYEQFKKASEKLAEQESRLSHYLQAKERTRRKNIFGNKKIASSGLSMEWERVGLKQLMLSFLKVAENSIIENAPPIFHNREYNISDKINIIRKSLYENKRVKFTSLFKTANINRQEIVVTFWGILELYKLEEIEIVQDKIFKDIYLQAGKNFPHTNPKHNHN